MNMTVTLDSRTDIPLHPLDLTYSGQSMSGSLASGPLHSSPLTSGGVSSASSSSMCLGLIQSYPPDSGVTDIADVVLGVPFMRSVYTVLAYDPPDAKGAFPNASTSIMPTIQPRLGLLSLINTTLALEEFHQERVLNQPLLPNANQAGSNSSTGSGGGSRSNVAEPGGKKLSVGVEVLLGILGFLFLICAIFGSWYLVQRRRRARDRREALARGLYVGAESDDDEKDRAALMQREAAFMLARRSTVSSRYGPSEDTVRAQRFEEYMKRRESDVVSERERIVSGYSEHTLPPTPPLPGKYIQEERRYTEMGFISEPAGDETLVNQSFHERMSLIPDDYPRSLGHTRMPTLEASAVAVPLLAHTRDESQVSILSSSPPERTPLGMGRPASHARIGSFGNDLSSSAAARMSATRSVSGPRPMSGRRSSAGSTHSLSQSSLRRSSTPLSGRPPSATPPPPPVHLAPVEEPALLGGSSAENSVGHGSS